MVAAAAAMSVAATNRPLRTRSSSASSCASTLPMSCSRRAVSRRCRAPENTTT
jgi:hypothetical protein